MKMKYLLIAVLAVSVSGCALFKQKPCPPTTDFVIVNPDRTPELDLKPVEWEVWNATKMAEEAAKPENKDNIIYVLRPQQATNLFDNLIDISDLTSKSLKNNSYYQKAVDDYRAAKAKEAEAKAASTKGKKK